MSDYKKPIIIMSDDLAEGIYASSGSTGNGDDNNGDDQGDSDRKCKSLYMGGVFVQGNYKPNVDGYKIGRGCEGCPAAWGYCAVKKMDYDGDFRPTWEKDGKLPDEKGY